MLFIHLYILLYHLLLFRPFNNIFTKKKKNLFNIINNNDNNIMIGLDHNNSHTKSLVLITYCLETNTIIYTKKQVPLYLFIIKKDHHVIKI